MTANRPERVHPSARGGRTRASTTLGSLILAVTAVVSACHSLIDPPPPPEAVALTPPPVYARWWAMAEACSGVTMPMGSVSWYVVPDGSPVIVDGRHVRGYWSAGSNRIVLSAEAQFDGRSVRHEMLHAL